MKKLLLPFSLLSLLFLAGCTDKQPVQVDESSSSPISFVESSFDFGVIKQSGGKVSHDFAFTYDGIEPIEITGVPTSCACTSAKVDKTNLNPGDTAVLTVKFNPNLHEEPAGKFFKTITLLTEPALADMSEVRIWVEVDLDLGPESYELKSSHDEEDSKDKGDGFDSYTSITSQKFSEILTNKDFTLLDVHIPEQEHIAGTDLFIPYDEIARSDQLPVDKDTRIVVYCRSGGMSRATAYQLAEMGYTDVFDLVGGKDAYDEFLKTNKEFQDLSMSKKVGYIDFEATVINKSNFAKLSSEFENEITLNENKTQILLTMDNHRKSLADFEYNELVRLDDVPADTWQETSNEMFGHHIAGVLDFPLDENPQVLTISGLPVDEVALNF